MVLEVAEAVVLVSNVQGGIRDCNSKGSDLVECIFVYILVLY